MGRATRPSVRGAFALAAVALFSLAGCTAANRGPNREYAINTWHSLRAHGVHDARLARLVRALQSGGQG